MDKKRLVRDGFLIVAGAGFWRQKTGPDTIKKALCGNRTYIMFLCLVRDDFCRQKSLCGEGEHFIWVEWNRRYRERLKQCTVTGGGVMVSVE